MTAVDPLIKFACAIGMLAAVILSWKFLESNCGRDWRIHAIYWAIAIAVIILLPTSISLYIFSDLTVALVGAVYPIYRATKAVCTPEVSDDKEWLQFWMLGGVLFMLTTWVDDAIKIERFDGIWLSSLTFTSFWLYFPKTCGALLIYEYITEPLISPKIKPLQQNMNNLILYIYQTLANAVHLYLLWFIFVFLPAGLKRTVAIAVGTVYPTISSITAVASDETEADTYWLTYWVVYGCLFLIMDLMETWLGRIPGFYSLIIFSTIYLMLPMFRGADKVFRKILVPLAGLQEMLLLRDSVQIKKQILKDLDPERAQILRKTVAKLFDDDDNDTDPAVWKEDIMSSGPGAKFLNKISNPFGKKSSPSGGDEQQPTETTNLV